MTHTTEERLPRDDDAKDHVIHLLREAADEAEARDTPPPAAGVVGHRNTIIYSHAPVTVMLHVGRGSLCERLRAHVGAFMRWKRPGARGDDSTTGN